MLVPCVPLGPLALAPPAPPAPPDAPPAPPPAPPPAWAKAAPDKPKARAAARRRVFFMRDLLSCWPEISGRRPEFRPRRVQRQAIIRVRENLVTNELEHDGIRFAIA